MGADEAGRLADARGVRAGVAEERFGRAVCETVGVGLLARLPVGVAVGVGLTVAVGVAVAVGLVVGVGEAAVVVTGVVRWLADGAGAPGPEHAPNTRMAASPPATRAPACRFMRSIFAQAP